MDAGSLDIEITESAAMEDKSIAALTEMASIGIRTSIDDFGTGFSSLSSLKRLPINSIKIDGSFVRDVSGDTNSREIVKAIIAMAHSLNMKVVAECVETPEQLEFLKEHRCDEVQGFLYSPPVSQQEFTEFFKSAGSDLIANRFTA